MSVELVTTLLSSAAVSTVAEALWKGVRDGLRARGVQRVPEELSSPQTLEIAKLEVESLPPDEARDLTLEALARAHNAANGVRAERLRQAKLTFNAAISLAVIGILIIFVGVALFLFRDAVAPGVLTSGIGAVTEVISAILFRLNHETNNRLDEVGKDLSAIEAAQIAMTLIDKIEDPAKRDDAIREAARDLRARRA